MHKALEEALLLISFNMQQLKKNQISEERISLPGDIEKNMVMNTLTLKKGGMETSLNVKGIRVKIEGNDLVIPIKKFTKNVKKLVNTFKAHVRNVLEGFEHKYTYKLQIAAVHFPMTVNFDKAKKEIAIKNFLGERVPRIARILPHVDVKVEKEFITLESFDKYAASQSAANIETATRITKRDRRVFQDGIWIIEKAGEAI